MRPLTTVRVCCSYSYYSRSPGKWPVVHYSVFSCLTDLFLGRLLLLNITHLDAQCVLLPLAPCLLRPYYHTNNIPQITQHFHLDEASSEGPYCTYTIRDDLFPEAFSLILQELGGRRMKGRNVSLNNIPYMYKHHRWSQNYIRYLLVKRGTQLHIH